ncbi:twin-arginine translocase TatA/TatE family subunit [Mucilaginibacter sp.]|jgi:sec-independent protein translocase protein TatA|uniref:Sec-independent protein translocase subunit TatA/TatB n=1 Tax=Mucilaginibacter sp. TaxID=1882438 RepID=UPI00356865FA
MLSSVFLFLNIGGGEMILIVFAALMLFGGEKLPELARGLGKGIRDFKDASEDVKREINNQINNYEEKKTEIAVTAEEEKVQSYEPVTGTLPAFEGHAATDAIEETELSNPEAPETYSHESAELKHPVTGQHEASAEADKAEEPVEKTIEEKYK